MKVTTVRVIRIFFVCISILIGGLIGYTYDMFLIGCIAGLLAGGILLLVEIGTKWISGRDIISGSVGLIIGLALANLISFVFIGSYDIDRINWLQIILNLALGYLGLMIGLTKQNEILELLTTYASNPAQGSNINNGNSKKILDTSVIIDGRIEDVCETSFLEGTLIVPRFVLQELQHIADSSDTLKRNRGRRGLDVLHKIQKRTDVKVQITDKDYPNIKEVDSKLLCLAKELNAKIMTNDFNLNKLAQLENVVVLNINELAEALKPVVLPGEEMYVHIIKEGKEYSQGVGYLDDGTMVVVDNGYDFIGCRVKVTVTSVLQTTAGRMIFAKLEGVSM